jgi:uncharacterized protein (TIGR02466 family)
MQNSEDRPSGSKLVAEAYFPTLIFFRDLPNGPEVNAVLKPAIYTLREDDPEGLVRSNMAKVGSWHSPDDLATRPVFATLCREIVVHAATLFEELGYDPSCGPEIVNMWANIHPRHGYNRSHTHPNVLWSGVYYVQSPPRAGRIVFGDPRPQALATQPIYRANRGVPPSVWTEVWYEPIEARILLFPAWLQHEVEPNLCDSPGPAGDRISISFNLVQRRRNGAAVQRDG